MKNKIIIRIYILFFSLVLISCGKDYSPEQKKYMEEVEKSRQE